MNIKKTTINGILTIGSSKILQQGINFVVTAVLANLLVPKDFGLIGIVTVFTGFVAVFSNLGLGTALVQRKNISDDQLSTLFWIGVLWGLGSALIVAAAAYPVSLFYEESLLVPLTIALSTNFLVTPFFIIKKKLLQKELKFQTLAIVFLIGIFGSGLCGILAAFLGFGVWSLVVQSLSLNLFYLAAFQFVKKWRARFIFNFRSCFELIRFGFQMVGTHFTVYIERHIDILIIGKLLGTTQLGYYALAFRIMFFPIRQISYTFNDVLFPVFSKIQDQLSNVRKGYLKSVKFTSLVSFPLMMVVFLVAEDFILIVFGEQWLPTVDIIKIMAFAGAIQSVSQIGNPVFPALNRPDIRMKMGIFNCVFLSLAIVIGSHWGLIGVAYAILFCKICVFFISQFFINRLIQITLLSVIKNLKMSILGCMVLFLVHFTWQSNSIVFLDGELKRFILALIIHTVTYCVFLIIFDRKDLDYVSSILVRKTKRESLNS
jgi:PST family polysaccharide transporter